jgi:hypothetical protein
MAASAFVVQIVDGTDAVGTAAADDVVVVDVALARDNPA